MRLDVRTPIGLMFAIIGVLLVVYGLVSDPEIYERSLGLNVNLWWGFVLVVFGSVMLALAWRSGRTKPPVVPAPAAPAELTQEGERLPPSEF